MENCFFAQARWPAPSLRSCSVTLNGRIDQGSGANERGVAVSVFRQPTTNCFLPATIPCLPQTVSPDLSSKNCTKHAAVFYFGEAQRPPIHESNRYPPWYCSSLAEKAHR